MAKLPDYIDLKTERIEEYDQNEDLFEGEAYEVFGLEQFDFFKKFNPKNPKLTYVNYNIFSIISKLYADLIWNEAPTITFQNEQIQAWFDSWRDIVNFDIKGYEATLSASYYGDSVLKLNVRETYPNSGLRQVFLDQIDPSIWFPKYNKYNPSLPVENHTLVFKKQVTKELTAYLLEIYGYGEITYKAYTQKNNSNEFEEVAPQDYFFEELKDVKVSVRNGNEYYYKTGVPLPLVTNIQNFSEPNDYFGISDYSDDVKSLAYSINQNLTAIQSIIQKHADPMLVVPESAIKTAIAEIGADKSNQSAQQFGMDSNSFSSYTSQAPNFAKSAVASQIIKNTKVIGMPSDGSGIAPQYVTWDAKLDATFEQIKQLKDAVLQVCDISPVLLTPDATFGQLSGTAIKRLAFATLNRAKRKKMYLKRGLEYAILTAQYLSKAEGLDYPNVTPEIPTIEFGEAFESDLVELATAQTQLLDAGLESRLGSIKTIYQMDNKQAQAKKEEIDTEKEENFNQIMGANNENQSLNQDQNGNNL